MLCQLPRLNRMCDMPDYLSDYKENRTATVKPNNVPTKMPAATVPYGGFDAMSMATQTPNPIPTMSEIPMAILIALRDLI